MSLKNNLSILQIVKLKIIDFQYFSVLFFFSFSAQNSSFQVIPPPTIGKHLLFYRNINNDTFKSNSDKFYNTKALWEATVDFPVLQTILSLVSHCIPHCIPQNTFLWQIQHLPWHFLGLLVCQRVDQQSLLIAFSP